MEPKAKNFPANWNNAAERDMRRPDSHPGGGCDHGRDGLNKDSGHPRMRAHSPLQTLTAAGRRGE